MNIDVTKLPEKLFYHDVSEGFPLDDRRGDKSAPLSLASIFYFVHRFSVGNTTWYRHGGYLFDRSPTTFFEDIQIELAADLDNRVNVALVYARSLLTEDPNILTIMHDNKMHAEIRARVEKGNIISDQDHASRYVAFGYAGDTKLVLLEVAATDVIEACKRADEKTVQQFDSRFSTLQVCAISPATPEIDEFFEVQVPSLLKLTDGRGK